LSDEKKIKETINKLKKKFKLYLKKRDFIGVDIIRKYTIKYMKKHKTIRDLYFDITCNDEYNDWRNAKIYLQKRPQFQSFIDMHKKLKMPGSYRRGMVAKDGKITRLIINYHITSPDDFDTDFKKIYYAGRGKKGKDYNRIVYQINDKGYYEENQTIIKHK
jgi:hypothetical protein